MNLALLLSFPLLQQVQQFPVQRYELDAAHSTVGFDGSSTLHDFSGKATPAAGHARADLGRLGAVAGGSVTVRAAELDTGSEGRDENMHADLEVERYPEFRFTLAGLDATLAGDVAEGTARGSFLIHGVERERAFPLTLERAADGSLHVTGRVAFPMTEHGIEPHSTMGVVKVADRVEAWVDLVFLPVAAPRAAARCLDVAVEETLMVHGGATESTRRGETFYLADGKVLRDTGPVWVLDGGGFRRVAPGPAQRLAAPASCDAAFADLEEQAASLRARYDKLPEAQRERVGGRILQALERLEAALEDAPAPGAARVETDGDWTRVLLGGRVWAEFRALEGEHPLPGTLADLEELPAAVQQALHGLRGLPAEARIHGASPAGRRTLHYRFGEARDAQVPEWAWEVESWTVAAAAG